MINKPSIKRIYSFYTLKRKPLRTKVVTNILNTVSISVINNITYYSNYITDKTKIVPQPNYNITPMDL